MEAVIHESVHLTALSCVMTPGPARVPVPFVDGVSAPTVACMRNARHIGETRHTRQPQQVERGASVAAALVQLGEERPLIIRARRNRTRVDDMS